MALDMSNPAPRGPPGGLPPGPPGPPSGGKPAWLYILKSASRVISNAERGLAGFNPGGVLLLSAKIKHQQLSMFRQLLKHNLKLRDFPRASISCGHINKHQRQFKNVPCSQILCRKERPRWRGGDKNSNDIRFSPAHLRE